MDVDVALPLPFLSIDFDRVKVAGGDIEGCLAEGEGTGDGEGEGESMYVIKERRRPSAGWKMGQPDFSFTRHL